MIFYSHSKTVKDTTTGTKLLRVHTEGVTGNALQNFSERISFDIDKDLLKEYITEICKYHDLGKYHDFFQDYLLKTKSVDPFDKQHARFGAYTLFEKYKQIPEIAFFLYYIIIHHHKSLTNVEKYEFSQNTKTSETKAIFEKQKTTILAKLVAIKADFGESKLEDYMHFPDKKAQDMMDDTIEKITDDESKSIQNYFLINYLFSLLIEADKLDASDTEVYKKNTIPSNLVDIKYPLGNIKNGDLIAMSQNELRNYVRGQVVAQLDDPNILSQKLFTLTAPTGIGKTLTALDFALKLRKKIYDKEKRYAQIIYGLPFINIIEQSINVYKNILGENGKLLAHYQYADALGEDKDTIGVNDTDEEKKYNQALMSLDTWQSDIVITSFVQLLQTLIGNRNKLLKKFNHFAGSIIILDEVQTIRLGLQPLIGASLFYLAKFLDARIVMMTATKPKIFELAETKLFQNQEFNISDKILSKELLGNNEAVFACFKRTKIVPLLNKKLENEEDFLAVFKEKWTETKSCLIVCNKVKRSIDMFKKISENVENPMYYLSTNIVPAVRLAIIKQIKEDIANNKAPILVATQVVEAGVDLDFDMGFRDLASIDSIIQVAGRINRNNNLAKMHSPLYIIDFGDCKDVYDEITRKNALKILTKEYLEEEYLNMVNTYFEIVENEKSFEYSREFFKSMQTLRYDGDYKFAVSKFKIIDDANYAISVFVELDEKATECLKEFRKLLNKEINKQEFDRNVKKDFNQRIIAVPKKLDNVLTLEANKSWLLTDNILLIKKEELTTYYDKNTGFIRDKDDNTATL